MSKRRDYKATLRSEVLLAKDADALRRFADQADSVWFDIAGFVGGPLPDWVQRRKHRALKIETIRAGPGDDPAFVKFGTTSVSLNVDRSLWLDTVRHDSSARFMIAHEIAHLTLHDHYELAFSNDPAAQVVGFTDEESAEWQANTLAGHILVPDKVAKLLGNKHAIAQKCGVPIELAGDRLRAACPPPKADLGHTFCRTCGSILMTRNGVAESCPRCA